MKRKFQAANDRRAVHSATRSPCRAAAPTTAARNSMPSASGSTRPCSASPSPTASATSADDDSQGIQPTGGRAPGSGGRIRGTPVGTTCTAWSGARASRVAARLRRSLPDGGNRHRRPFRARPTTIRVTLRARASSSAMPMIPSCAVRTARISVSAPSSVARPMMRAMRAASAGASPAGSTCSTSQGACRASASRLASRSTVSPFSGPTRASTRSPAGHGPAMALERM